MYNVLARTLSIDTSLKNLYKPQARPLLKFPAGSPLNLSSNREKYGNCSRIFKVTAM